MVLSKSNPTSFGSLTACVISNTGDRMWLVDPVSSFVPTPFAGPGLRLNHCLGASLCPQQRFALIRSDCRCYYVLFRWLSRRARALCGKCLILLPPRRMTPSCSAGSSPTQGTQTVRMLVAC